VRVLSACDPSDNAALAIAFFKEDYKWASDVETQASPHPSPTATLNPTLSHGDS
jgi:hypothetical protein